MTLKKTLIIVAVCCLLALATGGAMATNPAPVPSPYATSDATATQRMQQQQQAMGGAAGAGGNVSSDHWAVNLPSWGGSYGSELTVCATGWGWGAWWGPDHQCIELIFRLRALQATPVPRPSSYLSIDPPGQGLRMSAALNECTPPAKAKSAAAAKKAGACK